MKSEDAILDIATRIVRATPAPLLHPEPERLYDYTSDPNEDPDAETLVEHLSTCDDCTTLVLSLHEEEAPSDELRLDDAWRNVQGRLADGTRPHRAVSLDVRRESARVPSDRRTSLWKIAATALLPILGWAGWQVGEAAGRERPFVTSAVPLASGGQLGPAGTSASVPSGTPATLAVFVRNDGTYSVSVVATDRTYRRWIDDARVTAGTELAVNLPAGLPPGRYAVELESGGLRETLSYPFHVRDTSSD